MRACRNCTCSHDKGTLRERSEEFLVNLSHLICESCCGRPHFRIDKLINDGLVIPVARNCANFGMKSSEVLHECFSRFLRFAAVSKHLPPFLTVQSFWRH